MINKKIIICLSLITSFVFIPLYSSVKADTNTEATSVGVTRVSGEDRIGTNIAMMKNWSIAPTVIVVNANDYHDALLAASLAGKNGNCPIIISDSNKMTADTQQEIVSLGTKNVIVVGSVANISETVFNKLQSLASNVTRVSASDYMDESKQIAQQIGVNNGAAIATNENFPDALSFAPISAMRQIPIIFGDSMGLNSEINDYLTSTKSSSEYLIGGTGVLPSGLDSSNTSRLSGADRYATNLAVIKAFEGNLDFSTIYIATGNNFPDSLGASSLIASTKSPLVLVDSNTVDTNTLAYLGSKGNTIKKIVILGGTGVVNEAVVAQITKALKSDVGNSDIDFIK